MTAPHPLASLICRSAAQNQRPCSRATAWNEDLLSWIGGSGFDGLFLSREGTPASPNSIVWKAPQSRMPCLRQDRDLSLRLRCGAGIGHKPRHYVSRQVAQAKVTHRPMTPKAPRNTAGSASTAGDPFSAPRQAHSAADTPLNWLGCSGKGSEVSGVSRPSMRSPIPPKVPEIFLLQRRSWPPAPQRPIGSVATDLRLPGSQTLLAGR
jgi:hypothetical protein